MRCVEPLTKIHYRAFALQPSGYLDVLLLLLK